MLSGKHGPLGNAPKRKNETANAYQYEEQLKNWQRGDLQSHRCDRPQHRKRLDGHFRAERTATAKRETIRTHEVSSMRTMKPTSEILEPRPPADPEAERWVVGSAIIKPSVLDELGFLQPEDFYDETCRRSSPGCTNRHRGGEPIDGGLLVKRFPGDDWAARIAEILHAVPTPNHAVHYAKIVAREGQTPPPARHRSKSSPRRHQRRRRARGSARARRDSTCSRSPWKRRRRRAGHAGRCRRCRQSAESTKSSSAAKSPACRRGCSRSTTIRAVCSPAS